MRDINQMMDLILQTAENDERIRAVTLNGSRAGVTSLIDKHSDFDVAYFVEDVREFTKDKTWIECFGDILIVQYSMDWYDHPYDYDSRDTFVYLIQFEDGNRIDLSLVDLSNIEKEKENKEPKIVLLNKDNYQELEDSKDESMYNLIKPDEMEFYNTCNEFRWLSLYIAKGLLRKEIYYAKYAYDVMNMKMFIKMLKWKVGIDHDFNVTLGSLKRYLKRFLSDEEMERFHQVFPDGTYEDIWEKLIHIYDYFHDLEAYVAKGLNYPIDQDEAVRVRKYLLKKKKEYEIENRG